MTAAALYWFIVALLIIIGFSLAFGGFKLIKAALDDDSQSAKSGGEFPKKKGPSSSKRTQSYNTERRMNRSRIQPASRRY